MQLPKNIDLEQLYWNIVFGRSKRRISVDELKLNLEKISPPVFFISTGRTGTKWFADLFAQDKGSKTFHAPSPDLAAQNCFAYTLQKSSTLQAEEITTILGHIFLAGREQQLRYSYKSMKAYIETNNHLTFFAPVIAALLPQAKFVHLYRHPGDFVSSGLKRRWYISEISKLRQITPALPPVKKVWGTYNEIQKIAWLWNETNEFIETFKSSISKEQSFSFDFSSMDLEALGELIRFTGINIPESRLEKRLHQSLNNQQYTQSEKYHNWPAKEKELLVEMCKPLADKYGYKL
jgi:hypothetical protein